LLKFLKIKPYWKKFDENDDYLVLMFFVGLIGTLTSIWFIPFYLIFNTLSTIFSQIDFFNNSNSVTVILSFPIQFMIASIFSITVCFLFLRYSNIITFSDLKSSMNLFMEDINSYFHSKNTIIHNLILITTIVIQLINGYITGFIFSIFLLIPFYISYFLLLFLFVNFIEFNLIIALLPFIILLIVSQNYIIKYKAHFEDNSIPIDPKSLQPITLREFKIATSDSPPIICQSCRSFIPSDSKICSVCTEPILD